MCRCTGIILKILGVSVCIPCCIRNQIFGGFSGWFRKRSIIRSWDVPQSFSSFIVAKFRFALPISRENTDKLLIFNYLFAEGKSI